MTDENAQGMNKPRNLTPAEHMAIGNWNLARAEWPGCTPDQVSRYSALASANFAAATAKITALAVFDHDFEGQVDALAEEWAQKRREARARMTGR